MGENWGKVIKSGEKWGENGEKWGKVGKSGEKLEKVVKVGKSDKKWKSKQQLLKTQTICINLYIHVHIYAET